MNIKTIVLLGLGLCSSALVAMEPGPRDLQKFLTAINTYKQHRDTSKSQASLEQLVTLYNCLAVRSDKKRMADRELARTFGCSMEQLKQRGRKQSQTPPTAKPSAKPTVNARVSNPAVEDLSDDLLAIALAESAAQIQPKEAQPQIIKSGYDEESDIDVALVESMRELERQNEPKFLADDSDESGSDEISEDLMQIALAESALAVREKNQIDDDYKAALAAVREEYSATAKLAKPEPETREKEEERPNRAEEPEVPAAGQSTGEISDDKGADQQVSSLEKEAETVPVSSSTRTDKSRLLVRAIRSRRVERRMERIAKLLHDSKEGLNTCDVFGRKPLVEAALVADELIIQFLLDNGAAIDGQDQQGYTALMKAVTSFKTDVVRFLLEKHADATIQNGEGKTALDIAEKLDIQDLRRLEERKNQILGLLKK